MEITSERIFVQCSRFYRPKWRRIVPISRTSTVLLFWWSNIKNASPIRFSKSVVAAVQQKKGTFVKCFNYAFPSMPKKGEQTECENDFLDL